MGILDDAIRQHLDLKRQHGAGESELKQLEDEAFGPPSRPGEPDFPESEGSVEHSGNGNGNASPPDGGDSGADLAASGEGSPHAEAPVAEHPIVDEAPEPTEAEAVPETQESEEPTTFYDQTPDDEQHAQAEAPDEEPSTSEPSGATADEHPSPEALPPAGDEEVAASETDAAADPPVESLDTVEHPPPFDVVESEPAEAEPEAGPEPEDDHLDERDEEPGEDEEPEAQEALSEEESEEEESEEELEDEDSDDVLADTPEFLKDAPEDDELWFEQGKPKDFDF